MIAANPSIRQAPTSRSLRFPALYGAIIIASSLDVLLTGILLALGGEEANPLADAILRAHGFSGMVVFKYLVVGWVILSCEFVADRNHRKGQTLAVALVTIKASPVVWSGGLLAFAV
jgi:hypothetical protein